MRGHYLYGTPAERLRARLVERESGCIEFTGYRDPKGYGRIGYVGKRIILTHRLAYELAHGPIPAGMAVLHRCDNPPCCNVDHLFVGTLVDNNKDMWSKGRGKLVHHRGETHARAILTEADVLTIRREYVPRRVTITSLARRYGVAQSTIKAVLERRNWRHI